jgi:uncharacterized surface protein with fasciclin (FAS1) repeats
MKRMTLLAAVSAAALSLAACGDTNTTEADTADTAMPADETVPAEPMAATAGNIVAVAQGAPTFSTLVSAVTAADLGGTLSGTGPFTVFAPTNAAFEKIPQATRDTLMAPAGKEDLSGILTYHVVAGRVTAADLTKLITDGGGTATVTTVNGGTLTARLSGSNVVLTDGKGGTSTVTATDTEASNGVIHTIDTVLMPA